VRALAFVAVLPLMLDPAQACHRFSVWKYPYAQRCSMTLVGDDKIIPQPPTRAWNIAMDPRWKILPNGNIEVVRTPGMTDEEGRAIAIEALKAVMGP
jgi:hypothetical protein